MNIELLNRALKIQVLRLEFKKIGRRWVALMPKSQNPDGSIAELSEVDCLPWSRGIRALRINVATRYGASVFENSTCCHINLRNALHLPNWGRFGALPELAHYMAKAGLI